MVMLSNARFNTERRREYIGSILEEHDGKPGARFAFLRPAAQAWGDGWRHAYRQEGTICEVVADWGVSQDRGVIEILRPPRVITSVEFAARYGPAPRVDTFCNFNVAHCYRQAYGGPNLQDDNGSKAGGEVNANAMTRRMRASWHAVAPDIAAGIANAGGFVVAARENQKGIGHVMFVVDGSDASGVADKLRCFHVGAGIPRLTTVAAVFGAKPVEYFVDPATWAEWTGGAEVFAVPGPIGPTFSVDTDLKATRSRLTADWLDAYLASRKSALHGIGSAVIAAAESNSINATYIAAHAIWETAWGVSKICREKNNLFGWSAFDGSPYASAKGFPDRESCIQFFMERVDALYLTPGGRFFEQRACVGNASYGMNRHYATDPRWGEGVAAVARQLERAFG